MMDSGDLPQMNRNTVLALIAGLLGALAARYIAPAPVFAQNRPTGPTRIVLRDAGGRVIWSASGKAEIQPVSER